jgi:uncharacterized membrane protein YhhN
MKKTALIFFLTMSMGELISILFAFEFLHFVCKPLIMISLGGYYWLGVQEKERSNTVLLAICFSFLGDTLLLFGDVAEVYFIIGLIAFLFAHGFYILAYRQHRSEDSTDGIQGIQRIRLAFPIVLAGTGLIIVLFPSLGDLRFPVIIYTLVILLMVLNALFRYGRTTMPSFWMVFGGALLFMISDSILAINKFQFEIAHAGLYIMIPYIAAQFFIVKGLIAHAAKY